MLAVSLLAVDYVLVAPNVLGQFFFGKITIALYWLLQMAFLGAGRIGYRYFRYTRARHHARAEGPILPCCRPRRRRRSSAAGDRERRGQENLAGRHPVAVSADQGQTIRGIPVRGSFDALDSVVNDLAQRGTTVARVIFTPSAFEPDASPKRS